MKHEIKIITKTKGEGEIIRKFVDQLALGNEIEIKGPYPVNKYDSPVKDYHNNVPHYETENNNDGNSKSSS